MTLRPSCLLAPILALAASAASAQTPPSQTPASNDPSTVKPGVYALEPTHTQIMFGVRHMGFSTYYGAFSGASGALKLDPRDPAADSLQVTIPVSSIHTTSAALEAELKDAGWFDTARFPTATFRSTQVKAEGAEEADIEGQLTLHGVTRPVVLHAHFTGAGTNPMDHAYTVGFDVTGRIQRSQFGVSKYVPMVGDEVQLIISGVFELKQS